MNIDLKDRKLLYYLSLNSRMSLKKLGKKLNLHKNSVQYRIKRLEENGIIQNYYTVIDIFKLNYKCIRCYISYQFATPEIKKRIIDNFCTYDHIGVVYSITGSMDLTVIFWVRNVNDFQKFWLKSYNKFGKYFDKQFLSLYYKVQIYPKTYLIPNINDSILPDRTEYEIIIGGDEEVKVDRIDMQILNIIASDSRIPITTIAKKLNLSVKIIHYRLKKLSRLSLIKNFTINIDISKLGYQWFKVDIYLKDHSKKKEIIQYLINNPYMVAIDITTGFSDIEVEFNVKDTVHLGDILDDLSEKFQGFVKNYTYMFIKENHKLFYFPKLLN